MSRDLDPAPSVPQSDGPAPPATVAEPSERPDGGPEGAARLAPPPRVVPAGQRGPLGPDAIVWRQTQEWRMLAGAGTALLLQVAHPAVGAAVGEFSTYRERPWHRLHKTMELVFGGIVFDIGGRHEQGYRIHALHNKLEGVDMRGRRYHAQEPDGFFWVLATLIQVGVEMSELVGPPVRPHERPRLYAEWLEVGRILGLQDHQMPADLPAFQRYWAEMLHDGLDRNRTVDEVLATVARPAAPPGLPVPEPLWRLTAGAVGGRALGTLTLGLLPPELRRRWQLPWSRARELELQALGRSIRTLFPLLPRRARVHHWAAPAVLGRGR
ncbi:hypothetical protein PAI11_01590 [Patulibacter medicamentivorans]|jgi:uncharacterized protein (DUF2236 family)|uniref:ER-bound oxygenase mpaB/mpaB'/Rubber oxygenase catalytic domain-containing protein n=1 Tax=Patulibacter medicamentivorans TaxID=1097667 RepID=H0E053_9ACTN|nr:oxygenase MpaB family protein [Patulibacter medicamentivorans]EHN12948.1 hypothetical protein PAI11_01590 [Patulibacter medicamentivorans]